MTFRTRRSSQEHLLPQHRSDRKIRSRNSGNLNLEDQGNKSTETEDLETSPSATAEDLEIAPSATAEDLETRRPDGNPDGIQLRQNSLEKISELVAYRPSATVEAQITKTLNFYCIA